MSIFLLIRHGSNDFIGKALAGRLPGVHLNLDGRKQAEDLVERLASVTISLLCSSPLERAQETAMPLAKRLGLNLLLFEELSEINYGDWTGHELAELAGNPKWKQFNFFRNGTRIPNGELITEVQCRMVNIMEKLREQFPKGTIAVFSHGDPIKSAIAYYAGIPLDFLMRIDISPASVTGILVNNCGPRLLFLNNTGRLHIEPEAVN